MYDYGCGYVCLQCIKEYLPTKVLLCMIIDVGMCLQCIKEYLPTKVISVRCTSCNTHSYVVVTGESRHKSI